MTHESVVGIVLTTLLCIVGGRPALAQVPITPNTAPPPLAAGANRVTHVAPFQIK